MDYHIDASEMANRMLHAGATVGDLRRAVTHEMMMAVGLRMARHLADQKVIWEGGFYRLVIVDYRPPRRSAQWAVCVKRDLTVETIEVETYILALKTIELLDMHDRAPVAPFSANKVVALDPLSTTTYKRHGRICGFPVLLEV